MRVLLTGAGGQVAHELARRAGAREVELLAYHRAALDLTDADAVAAVMAASRPDLVINGAAYTAVDRAESEPQLARAVNVDAPAHLAAACDVAGVPLIHLSTDFVFDGTTRRPYRPDDATAPAGVYARSKAAGEEQVRSLLQQHLILRLSWVFGAHGHNFLKTVLRLAEEREELRVVDDQYGCPTWAGHIADAVWVLAERALSDSEPRWGTYHFCGQPVTTWHGFAVAIIEAAKRRGALKIRNVRAITTAEYPLPAPRPAWSVLDCSSLTSEFGIAQADWRLGLDLTLNEIFGTDGL